MLASRAAPGRLAPICRCGLSLLIPLLLSVGCGDSDARPESSGGESQSGVQAADAEASSIRVDLRQIRRIGWLDSRDSAERLTATEREYAAGVLSGIAGVDVGPSDSLFVLDRDYQKIVVFGPDGSFGRLILGGYGDGPGEFNRPRGLSVSGAGEIAVLDQGNVRLTRLTRSGGYLSSFRTNPRDLDLQTRNDTFFVTQFYQQSTQSALTLYTLDGEHAGGLIEPTPAMLDLSLHGEPGLLARTSTGRLLFASPRVGEWYESGPDGFTRHGQPLFTDLEGRIVSQQRGSRTVDIRVAPAAPRGIVRTTEGSTLIIFDVRYPEFLGSSDLTPGTWIAVYEPDGSYLGKSRLFPDSIDADYPQMSRGSDHLYFVHWQPYPHIGQYEFSIARDES